MRRTSPALALGAFALAAALCGCDGGDESADSERRPDGPPPAAQIALAGKGCPGTRPSPEPPFPGKDFNYGNRYIGVNLWSNGRLVASRGGQTWGQVMRDGAIWAKVGWWRAVPGRLHILGERLDASAPPLQASVPAGYGSTGFQATGLTFPTTGCWWVVGSVAGHELEFVVRVTKRH